MLTEPVSAVDAFSPVFELPVPAYEGRAVSVARGTLIRITDVQGHQIGDMFAFVRDRPSEWLSTGACRTAHTRLFPEVGTAFVTQFLRPILTLVADSSPGVHDMLYPPCSPAQYKAAGVVGHHPSCRENFEIAAVSAGMPTEFVPEPVNLFQNTPPDADGILIVGPAASAPGDYVLLRAEIDLVLVLTACSYDLGDANGDQCTDLLIELDTTPLGIPQLDD
jgi:uncharacterized protein YcgI (DUF1989 family)